MSRFGEFVFHTDTSQSHASALLFLLYPILSNLPINKPLPCQLEEAMKRKVNLRKVTQSVVMGRNCVKSVQPNQTVVRGPQTCHPTELSLLEIRISSDDSPRMQHSL